MSIQKINFTSALLSKPQTQTLASKEVADKPISENQPQEENGVTEVIAEEKPNHTVRNWSIGLGAAATLIGLGVAGRKGHLGKGLQKLLGGAEKESGKLADDAACSVGHTKPVTEAVTETASRETKPASETIAETATRETKPEPVKTETTAETPTAPKAKAAEAIKPGVKEVLGAPITKAEIEAIEATLDKTMPKITDDLLSIDISRFPRDGSEYQKLIFDKFKIPKTGNETVQVFHEGKQIDAFYYEGKLSSVHIHKNENEQIFVDLRKDHTISSIRDGSMYANYYLNTLTDIAIKHQNYDYWYDASGKLEHIFPQNSANKATKCINYHPGTKDVRRIEYYETPGEYNRIKIERYDNGKLVEEVYNECYGEPSMLLY